MSKYLVVYIDGFRHMSWDMVECEDCFSIPELLARNEMVWGDSADEPAYEAFEIDSLIGCLRDFRDDLWEGPVLS